MTLLSIPEAEVAKSQGWLLSEVYDLTKKRWTIEVLPTDFATKMSPQVMAAQVFARAKNRDLVCIKALQLINQYHKPKP